MAKQLCWRPELQVNDARPSPGAALVNQVLNLTDDLGARDIHVRLTYEPVCFRS